MNNKATNFVSIDVIINDILKHPLLKDTNPEDIVEHAVSVLKIAKVPGTYKSEPCFKDIVNYKTMTPSSSLNIKTVDHVCGKTLIPMIMSSDSLANFPNATGKRSNLETYSINGNVITTAFKTGKILITFDTLSLDENDIPMIPNSESLLRAVKAYIKMQMFTIMVDMGKMSENALRRVEQEYYWNIGKYQSEQQGFTNEDDMEAFINSNKQFLTTAEHNNRYAGESQREHINIL